MDISNNSVVLAAVYINTLSDNFKTLSKEISKLQSLQNTLIQENYGKAKDTFIDSMKFIVVIFIFSLTILYIISSNINNSITNSLKELFNSVKELAGGNLNINIDLEPPLPEGRGGSRSHFHS